MSDSNSEIFYEKYRPSQLSQVIGQDQVTSLLRKSCEKNFFHHSYIFSGKHGLGKTSCARILASILTCENRQEGSSVVCKRCAACRIAHSGSSSVDIYELDGASNSKVENTRQIIEGSRYSPQQFKRKVFIIDECHRLSTAAMTSLLKTLEEPPPTSFFILCTTELEKVPPEILSRCQKMRFRPVSYQILSNYLECLFKAKKIQIEKAAVDCIVAAASGSVRDALEFAQEASLLSDGTEISERSIADMLGFVGRSDIFALVREISEKNIIGAFDILEKMFDSGSSARVVCSELSNVFRNIMLYKISKTYVSGIAKTEQDFIDSVKGGFEVGQLADFLKIFEEAERAFCVNINSRWVLESVVVKLIA